MLDVVADRLVDLSFAVTEVVRLIDDDQGGSAAASLVVVWARLWDRTFGARRR